MPIGRTLIASLSMITLAGSLVLATAGCVGVVEGSDPTDPPASNDFDPTGTGGAVSIAGPSGTVQDSRNLGSGGAPGMAGGSGAVPPTGNPTADAGAVAQRDSGASTSRSDAGASAPTFTQIYNDIFSQTPVASASGCWGASCHAGPGSAKAIGKIDMSTKAKAYTGARAQVSPGNPSSSRFYTDLSSGKMPVMRPKLTAALLQEVSAWISAGAPNN
jgi:hypothetical protein